MVGVNDSGGLFLVGVNVSGGLFLTKLFYDLSRSNNRLCRI